MDCLFRGETPTLSFLIANFLERALADNFEWARSYTLPLAVQRVCNSAFDAPREQSSRLARSFSQAPKSNQ